ncbi:MAG: topoisomerase DNA-binding C4 zinc finger domain-containing protein, partial [Candidatus Woesearchaeota archaeon]|nr:topoisomerase DNA-binding C4 zinc finger domain-containing protein [Candidatus Woesearchaeota archaeon]
IGKCPNCADGTLELRRGKFGRFIACNKYPECKTTFSLPRAGLVKTLKKECPVCRMPMITIQFPRKRPQEVCINPNCPSKKIDEEKAKQEEKKCPKCSEGKLILRRSVYGTFLGCSTYPKCKYTEKLMNGAQKQGQAEEAEEKEPAEEAVEPGQSEENDSEE